MLVEVTLNVEILGALFKALICAVPTSPKLRKTVQNSSINGEKSCKNGKYWQRSP